MKVYTDLTPVLVEHILRSPAFSVAHTHTIYSDEGIYTVNKKLHKWHIMDAEPYTRTVHNRTFQIDPAKITFHEAWQIPVPHDIVRSTVSTYNVSPHMSFIVEQNSRTTYYFSGDDFEAISPWLQKIEAELS